MHTFKEENAYADWMVNYSINLPLGLNAFLTHPKESSSSLLINVLQVSKTRFIILS